MSTATSRPDDAKTKREKGSRPYNLANPMVVDGVFYIPSDALLPGINKIVLKDNELFAILDERDGSCIAHRCYHRSRDRHETNPHRR